MSEFLDNLNQRRQHMNRRGNDKFIERRDFCVANLQQVADRAVELIKAAYAEQFEKSGLKYRESAEDRDRYEMIRYKNEQHAAWLVGSWPPRELPDRLVMKDYNVYLLDSGKIVSVTNYYNEAMPVRVEPYDPYRYETQTLNAMTIYHNIAQLPGDPEFQKESEEQLPA